MNTDAMAIHSAGDILRRKLPAWLKAPLGADEVTIVEAEQLVGGHSNETWKISCSHTAGGEVATASFIVRWGHPDGIQAPYDIPGQFALLKALAATSVPVPTPLWLELDSDVIGAPFLTMRVAPGITPNRFLTLDDPLRDGKLRAHVGMLARIHGLDWKRWGIDKVLPPASADQCARDAMESVRGYAAQRGLVDERWFAHAMAWLAERAPSRSEVGLLHGDPNLTNYRFEGVDIVAVLDWDAARLSDPLWDVGAVSGAMWLYFADEPPDVQERERQRFLELYHRASGRPLADLPFWESLFVLRASVLTHHPALDNRMSTILRAKINAITGFAQ